MDTDTPTSDIRLTGEAVDFATALRFDDLSEAAVHLARRCVLDGLAVMLAGSEQPALEILERYIDKIGGAEESRLLGFASRRVPAHLAALWHGLAGHAMDWDDTQLSENKGRAYGLLPPPTTPPPAMEPTGCSASKQKIFTRTVSPGVGVAT